MRGPRAATFFTSWRRQYIGTTVTGYPVDNPGTGPPFSTILSNGTYKLTYQINAKNKISQMLNFERKQQPFRNAGNNQYADAVYNQDLVEWMIMGYPSESLQIVP